MANVCMRQVHRGADFSNFVDGRFFNFLLACLSVFALCAILEALCLEN